MDRGDKGEGTRKWREREGNEEVREEKERKEYGMIGKEKGV